jgi:predicted deacetylase
MKRDALEAMKVDASRTTERPRLLCVAIHDVAPETWRDCEALLEMLQSFAPLPLTLAVVPDYHGHGRADSAPWFVRAVNEVVAEQGCEIALHGYRHLDDAAAASGGAKAWLQRHLLTAGEGEFAALSGDEAATRLEGGVAVLRDCGWQPVGFIPPAWLAGEGARQALRHSGLEYSSSHSVLTRLADGARIAAPCITASARSAWRRGASAAWLQIAAAQLAHVSLLRIALHPTDARSPLLMTRWRDLIARMLAERTPLTKHQALRNSAGKIEAWK